MKLSTKLWMCALSAALCAPLLALQTQTQDAKQIVQQAVSAETLANRDDHSHWRYLRSEAGGNSFVTVETEYGEVSRHVNENGRPASAKVLAEDDAHNQKFIHDPAMQQKQRQNGAHDDKSADELMNLLPQAFVWKVESETPENTTLHFEPNPNFTPPDMEARVMGAMSGTLVVDKEQHRIRTMKGQLESDVTIGFGLLARIKQGSTFDVERRQVAPGCWAITETHVHISGHALLFHTIGQQEDEVKTGFTLVPPGTTLEQGVGLLIAAAK
ncbi:MAG: hypothetical protein ACLQM6_11020 [Acidobacteriaceae bacterium]